MTQNLVMIWRALFAGWKLRKSAAWKDVGALVALVTPAIFWASKFAAARGWLPAELTEYELDRLENGVWQLVGVASAYWLRATSTTVGWGQRDAPGIGRSGGQAYEPGYFQEEAPEPGVGPAGAPAIQYDPRLGVLYRFQGLREVPHSDLADYHPGDDPGLNSFNRPG